MKEISVIALLGAAFVGAIFVVVTLLGLLSCHELVLLNPSYEIRYEFLNGCMIKYNGLWIPYKNVRGVE